MNLSVPIWKAQNELRSFLNVVVLKSQGQPFFFSCAGHYLLVKFVKKSYHPVLIGSHHAKTIFLKKERQREREREVERLENILFMYLALFSQATQLLLYFS